VVLLVISGPKHFQMIHIIMHYYFLKMNMCLIINYYYCASIGWLACRFHFFVFGWNASL